MKYNELQTDSSKDRKRVGRGIAAGQGKTAGRGTKGQNSRTGSKFGASFMGGQRALMQAIPKKKGFRSIRVPAQVVYSDLLNELTGTVDNAALYEAGLITTPYHTVKIIARGEYTGKADIKVQAASKSVKEAIVKNGGTFEVLPTPIKPTTKKKEDK